MEANERLTEDTRLAISETIERLAHIVQALGASAPSSGSEQTYSPSQPGRAASAASDDLATAFQSDDLNLARYRSRLTDLLNEAQSAVRDGEIAGALDRLISAHSLTAVQLASVEIFVSTCEDSDDQASGEYNRFHFRPIGLEGEAIAMVKSHDESAVYGGRGDIGGIIPTGLPGGGPGSPPMPPAPPGWLVPLLKKLKSFGAWLWTIIQTLSKPKGWHIEGGVNIGWLAAARIGVQFGA
jgi:hypothetical protein